MTFLLQVQTSTKIRKALWMSMKIFRVMAKIAECLFSIGRSQIRGNKFPSSFITEYQKCYCAGILNFPKQKKNDCIVGKILTETLSNFFLFISGILFIIFFFFFFFLSVGFCHLLQWLFSLKKGELTWIKKQVHWIINCILKWPFLLFNCIFYVKISAMLF